MGQHRPPLPGQQRVFGKVPTSPITARSSRSSRASKPGHVSEMDWTNKNVNPSKVVQVGDDVEVMVLDVDEERRRISLGMKQVTSNPWETFAGDPQEGRQGVRPDQVDHRLRHLHRPGRRHRRPDPPVRHQLEHHRRGRGAQLQEGRQISRPWCWPSIRSASASASASSSSSRIRSGSWRPTPRADRQGTVKEVDAKGATIDLGDGARATFGPRHRARPRRRRLARC